jgi:hypothetical protein
MDAPVRGQALYYMPHCEQFLYDGVLDACARLRALHRVALLGNSFAEYAEREDLRPADQRRREASTLLQLQPLSTGALCAASLLPALCLTLAFACPEIPLPTARSFPVSAFNSMALHVFSVASAAEALTRITTQS